LYSIKASYLRAAALEGNVGVSRRCQDPRPRALRILVWPSRSRAIYRRSTLAGCRVHTYTHTHNILYVEAPWHPWTQVCDMVSFMKYIPITPDWAAVNLPRKKIYTFIVLVIPNAERFATSLWSFGGCYRFYIFRPHFCSPRYVDFPSLMLIFPTPFGNVICLSIGTSQQLPLRMRKERANKKKAIAPYNLSCKIQTDCLRTDCLQTSATGREWRAPYRRIAESHHDIYPALRG
jgi:hypothetical protein